MREDSFPNRQIIDVTYRCGDHILTVAIEAKTGEEAVNIADKYFLPNLVRMTRDWSLVCCMARKV